MRCGLFARGTSRRSVRAGADGAGASPAADGTGDRGGARRDPLTSTNVYNAAALAELHPDARTRKAILAKGETKHEYGTCEICLESRMIAHDSYADVEPPLRKD